ncbi:MAG: NAD-dependent epimerase/dehydratase family protein [Elusimicrobia bacterium]|nr:NAD-dependent epimerase/dehydratase family protein [Elusimicrobiota bacterium]MDE2511178.1 NAD-dependent epimerase/dehydratase family protein [Elusimicrobiota bacterium]
MSRLVAVTGASGYVGGRIAAALGASGNIVRRLVRTPSGPNDVAFRLGEPVDPKIFHEVDAVIHAAHDFRAFGAEEQRRVNVDGSRRLFDAARAAGVRRIVAVSSVSAFEGCRSDYGRAKLELEDMALKAGGIAVRPGLVYGDGPGGMFGTLSRLCCLPVLPLPDGGHQPLLLGHADDVSAALVAALDWDPSVAGGPVTLAHPEAVSFAGVLRMIAGRVGRKPLFLPVPSALMLGGLGLAEAISLRLPARRDSLSSLLNPNPAPDFGPTRRLGPVFRAFRDWAANGH